MTDQTEQLLVRVHETIMSLYNDIELHKVEALLCELRDVLAARQQEAARIAEVVKEMRERTANYGGDILRGDIRGWTDRLEPLP